MLMFGQGCSSPLNLNATYINVPNYDTLWSQASIISESITRKQQQQQQQNLLLRFFYICRFLIFFITKTGIITTY